MRPARARTFSYFVLSDTNDPAVAAAEEAAVAAWRRPTPIATRIIYRRRTDNTGFKAGNVRDFCDRWGKRLRTDAAARRRQPDVGRPAIVRLVRMMQAHPQDRHPAEPRRRHAVVDRRSRASSSSACGTACAPTPWARPGGSATADRSGATTPWCASSRSTSSASCRCCPASRRSAATCSRTTRSRRRLMRRAGYEVRVLPGRERQLGGESADHARLRQARRALVPGQHAVHQAARHCRACIP